MEEIKTIKDITRIFEEKDHEKPEAKVKGICRGLVYNANYAGPPSAQYSCFLELKNKEYFPLSGFAYITELSKLKLSSEKNKEVLIGGHIIKGLKSKGLSFWPQSISLIGY